MNGRAIQHAPVFERELRTVPWALHAIVDKPALGEHVRAGLGEREYTVATPDQQNGNTLVADSLRRALAQFGFGQHGNEVLG